MTDIRKRSIATITVLAVIAVVLLIYACVPEAEAETEQLYQGVKLDSHLLELDKKALEDAYRDHLKLLFSVWLKDDVNVVHRINAGLRNARRAYGDAAARIEERQRQIK